MKDYLKRVEVLRGILNAQKQVIVIAILLAYMFLTFCWYIFYHMSGFLDNNDFVFIGQS